MKKILKLFLYLFVFIVFFILFLPKESFYNLLEKELEKSQIIVSNETKKDKPFSFSVLNTDIFYQGINMAKVDDITFAYSILDVNKINIKSNGTFGEVSGDINILKREIKIELNASALMKNSYSNLLRSMKFENERYIYEYKF